VVVTGAGVGEGAGAGVGAGVGAGAEAVAGGAVVTGMVDAGPEGDAPPVVDPLGDAPGVDEAPLGEAFVVVPDGGLVKV
jgi:hypothetical protein